MFGINLKETYASLRTIGLVGSQREFSRVWLGRGQHYLRNIEPRDRCWRVVDFAMTDGLRQHLLAVADRVPRAAADEIMEVITEMDRDRRVADTMSGWGR